MARLSSYLLALYEVEDERRELWPARKQTLLGALLHAHRTIIPFIVVPRRIEKQRMRDEAVHPFARRASVGQVLLFCRCETPAPAS